MIRISLFSDIHGKILLPFKMVHRYQEVYNKKVDYILQCGDLGVFPDLDKLDKATLRHARTDADELGFHDDFVEANPAIASFLKDLAIPMICVRGNHEDHDYLDDLEQRYAQQSRFPIDVYESVWLCKSGELQSLEKEQEQLTFIGLGRIGDRKGRRHSKYIQEYEHQKLKKSYKSKVKPHLLITHDSPSGLEQGYGSTEIREALDRLPFAFHFFGHTGKPYSRELDDNGVTESIKIKELEFLESGALPPNCMLMLEKEGEDILVECMPLSFTNLFTRYNWRYL